MEAHPHTALFCEKCLPGNSDQNNKRVGGEGRAGVREGEGRCLVFTVSAAKMLIPMSARRQRTKTGAGRREHSEKKKNRCVLVCSRDPSG